MSIQAENRWVIRGGQPLDGDITVGGMKNAATPIIAATLLVRDTCVLENVPRLSDVDRMLDILRSLGTKVDWTGANELTIDASGADLGALDAKSVKAMRSSILLMAPLLSRFHRVTLPEPGGCIIGNRPIDAHLDVLSGFGAKIDAHESGSYTLSASGLRGSPNILPVFSVTATENALMAAVLAEGATVIKLAAAEPHVQDLGKFLISAGAKISGLGTHTLHVEGVKALRGTRHRIIPDQIEAGTFAALGAVTKGTLNVRGVMPEHMDIILLTMAKIGARFELKGDTIILPSPGPLKSFRMQTLPYPGFPTDLQAPFGVLATQCAGTSLIQDPMFEGRMGYVNELMKMGANATICDPHRVVISGPTPLYGNEIRGLDLRAGATLVIAGLIATGETVLHGASVIDRGYERLDERLRAVGADVRRVEVV